MNENKVIIKSLFVCLSVCFIHHLTLYLYKKRRGLFTAGKTKNATTTWESFSCSLKRLTLQSSLSRLREVNDGQRREKAAQFSSVVFMILVVFVHVASSSFTSHLFFCSSTKQCHKLSHYHPLY